MVLVNVNKQYKENAILTASPEELTMMLYNGLIKFLMTAISGVEEKNNEKTNNNIIRSQDILYELLNSLDMKYEVSYGMQQLYDYMINRLIEANIKKDVIIIKEVLGFSKQFRDTWAEAMKIAKSQQLLMAK